MVFLGEWWQRVAEVAAQATERGEGWYLLEDPRGARLGRGRILRPADCGGTTEFLEQLSSGDWVFALSYELGLVHSGIMSAAIGRASCTEFAEALDALPDPSFAIARTAEELLPGQSTAGQSTAEEPAAGAPTVGAPTAGEHASAPASAPAVHSWRRSDARYLADVASCQQAIRAGDSYVLCLTDTAEAAVTVPTKDAAAFPLAVYAQLTSSAPALRGGLLVAGEQALVSASPEQFLSVRAGTVTTHPIKGTRPRGETAEADAALAAELAADPKELAENLMIVDLMRNDLSRVCLPGSVRVPELYRVETHPRVHQLVSTVCGQLREGVTLAELLQAAFPGGSMTGAPKQAACGILAGLEGAPRGLYSGCFGWISGARAGSEWEAELAMTIRAVHITGLPVGLRADAASAAVCELRATVGAGGGITSDSIPAAELAERNLKAAAPLAAVSSASATAGTV